MRCAFITSTFLEVAKNCRFEGRGVGGRGGGVEEEGGQEDRKEKERESKQAGVQFGGMQWSSNGGVSVEPPKGRGGLRTST